MSQKGVAKLICWDCQMETKGVVGTMREVNEEVFDDGPHFYPDDTFVCPHCEAEDDFGWSDFRMVPQWNPGK